MEAAVQRSIIGMRIRLVDIGMDKPTFYLVAVGGVGQGASVEGHFRQKQLLAFTANQQTSPMGLEACSGAHFLGQALRQQDHDVQLIAAKFLKPSVRSNTNNLIHAEPLPKVSRARTCICRKAGRSLRSQHRQRCRSVR